MTTSMKERLELLQQFSSDIARIQQCLLVSTRAVTPLQAVGMWLDYSENHCAMWLQLAARVDNEQGLYSYAFFTSDVARFRTIGIERKDEMLNSGEAALMLGLDKRVAAALLRNKQFFNRKKHGCQKFVSRSEMKAFKEKYIFAREIASKFNTRSIRVVNHMARLGVKSFCLKSGKSLTYFYIRDEVEMLAVPPTTHMLQKYL